MRLTLLSLLLTACLAANAYTQDVVVGLTQENETPSLSLEVVEVLGENLANTIPKAVMKAMLREMGSGKATNVTSFMLLTMGEEDFQQALGFTEEKLVSIAASTDVHTATMEARMEEIGTSMFNFVFPPDGASPSDESLNEFLATIETSLSQAISQTVQDVDSALAEHFTAEQTQQLLELQIALMPVMPFANPQAFEALDLTDEQREHLKELQKELEPDYEKMLDQFVDDMMLTQEKRGATSSGLYETEWDEVFVEITPEVKKMIEEGRIVLPDNFPPEEMEKIMNEEGISNARMFKAVSPEEQEKREQEIRERLMQDPEYKSAMERMSTQGREFQERFKSRMFEVLTAEQREKFMRLINNPPEYAKKMRETLKEMFGEMGIVFEDGEASDGQQAAAEEKAIWVPGPNSWRPGMPLPVGVPVRQSPGRFPREE
jgi:hypothetical protein